MEYEILLDLVSYQQYTGNIERELTDYIFGSKWDVDYWEVPQEWQDRVILFPDMVDDNARMTLCNIVGKIYTPEEVRKYSISPCARFSEGELSKYPSVAEEEPFNDLKYDVEPGYYSGEHPFYHCFRIFWHFELTDDKEAKKMAEFLVQKAQDFMMTMPEFEHEREMFSDRKEIPAEIYRLEKILVE